MPWYVYLSDADNTLYNFDGAAAPTYDVSDFQELEAIILG